MSYLTCTNCGQKAPDTATKCQQCGRAFGRPPESPGDSASRRSPTSVLLLLASVALIALAGYQFWPRSGQAPSVVPVAAPPETTSVSAPPPTPKESKPAPADSARAVPAKPARPAEESRAPAPDTARAAADTALSVAPATAPQPVTIDVAHQRIAQVYANLRAEPSNTAAVVRVLQPGEVVSVDSLQQGWYRVVADQQPVGYVAQQYLDTLPPRSP